MEELAAVPCNRAEREVLSALDATAHDWHESYVGGESETPVESSIDDSDGLDDLDTLFDTPDATGKRGTPDAPKRRRKQCSSLSSTPQTETTTTTTPQPAFASTPSKAVTPESTKKH